MGMEQHIREIVRATLAQSPEEMLEKALRACIELSDATGGSILGEEGPALQILYSDVEALIGLRVPFDSIAGVTVRKGVVVYTYAPSDKRHFEGIDRKIEQTTQYLLSIPVPSVSHPPGAEGGARNSGALQLLFDRNILPDIPVEEGPREFPIQDFRGNPLYEQTLKDIFWLLPIVAFGSEVVKLRETSYQVIHELKNKLISAISWVDYLKEDLGAAASDVLQRSEIIEDFGLVDSSLREGTALAKNYLHFTKLYTPVFEPVDINDVLRETAASLRALAQEMQVPGLRVDTCPDPAVTPRLYDSGQLKMAFFNLGKNAVEAIRDAGNEQGRIELASVVGQDSCNVTISDNGPGMPPEIADNLFVPFRTKREGGTGLGLTIAKKIIDVHGGSICCETGNGGTVFRIVM